MKVRLSDVEIGQDFETFKGVKMTRVQFGDSGPKDFYLYNPDTHRVDYMSLNRAWDTSVLLNSKWRKINEGSYTYLDSGWLLEYSPSFREWFLEHRENEDESPDQWFTTKDFTEKDTVNVKLWAEEIINEVL